MKRGTLIATTAAAEVVVPRKPKQHRIIPHRYEDLNFWPDGEDADAVDIYYRKVHVGSVCTEGGGWRRIDRPLDAQCVQRMLGFRWLGFEDRRKVYEFFTHNLPPEHVASIPLRPFSGMSSETQSGEENRYYQALRSSATSEDTWLYEKLTTFRKVSRKAESLPLSQILKDLEDIDEEDDDAVLRRQDYLRKRVRSVAYLLAQQINYEKIALKGSLHDVYKCLAFCLLSCGKTEGLLMPLDFCRKQIDLLKEFIVQKPDLKYELQKCSGLFNLQWSTYCDAIYIEDLAFNLLKIGVPLTALIYPPSSEIYNITLEHFVQTVIYKEIVRAGDDKEQVLRALNALFTCLVAQGDMIKLATCVCAVLSCIEGAETVVAYHQLILKRTCGSTNTVIHKYAHISSELIDLNMRSTYDWLIVLLKRIGKMNGFKSLLIVDLPQSESLEFYNMVLSMFAIRTGELECATIYDWMAEDEIASILEIDNVRHCVTVTYHVEKNTSNESLRIFIFLKCVHIELDGKQLLDDWSDTEAVINYVYENLAVSKLDDNALHSLCGDDGPKAFLANLIFKMKAGATILENWTALVLMKFLNVPSEKLKFLKVPFNAEGIMASLDLFITKINMSYKWYDFCRFVNRNVSFHYRFKRIFDEDPGYAISFNFFTALVRLMPPQQSLYSDIVNGSTCARFQAREFTSIANLCICLITKQSPRYTLPLDIQLANLGIRTNHTPIITMLPRLLPYYHHS